jgi:hypothetical protein
VAPAVACPRSIGGRLNKAARQLHRRHTGMVLVRQPDRHVAARAFVTAIFTLLAGAFPLFSCRAATAPNKIMEAGSDQGDVSEA